MLTADRTVFLFDVDNTLLDNDRFAVDLGSRLSADFGDAERDRYWDIFAKRRDETGYADYLGSLQQLRAHLHDDPRLLGMSEFLLEYPFPRLLFPAALDAVRHLRSLGRTAVLSDGDIVYQPRKIQRSGIWDAVDGRVLIYIHKERSLDHLQRSYPASRYVIVDDKANLLAAMKRVLGDRLTTVFVRQGHYAISPESRSAQPAADLCVDRIGDLINLPSSLYEVPS